MREEARKEKMDEKIEQRRKEVKREERMKQMEMMLLESNALESNEKQLREEVPERSFSLRGGSPARRLSERKKHTESRSMVSFFLSSSLFWVI